MGQSRRGPGAPRVVKPPPRHDWGREGTDGFGVEGPPPDREIHASHLADYGAARRKAGALADELGVTVYVFCHATGHTWPVKPTQ